MAVVRGWDLSVTDLRSNDVQSQSINLRERFKLFHPLNESTLRPQLSLLPLLLPESPSEEAHRLAYPEKYELHIHESGLFKKHFPIDGTPTWSLGQGTYLCLQYLCWNHPLLAQPYSLSPFANERPLGASLFNAASSNINSATATSTNVGSVVASPFQVHSANVHHSTVNPSTVNPSTVNPSTVNHASITSSTPLANFNGHEIAASHDQVRTDMATSSSTSGTSIRDTSPLPMSTMVATCTKYALSTK